MACIDWSVIKLHLYNQIVNQISLRCLERRKATMDGWCQVHTSTDVSNEDNVAWQLVPRRDKFRIYMPDFRRGKTAQPTASV